VLSAGLALLGFAVVPAFTLVAGRNEQFNSAEIGCVLWGVTLVCFVVCVVAGLLLGGGS